MTRNNEEINAAIRKIKKCLSLANSTNEYEAQQAMKHARILMDKFQLDSSDIEYAEIFTETSTYRNAFNSWHNALLGLIERFFNVAATIYTKSKRIEWHGEKLNVSIAGYSYHVLHRKCSAARAQYMRDHLKRCKKLNKTKRADAYALAWVQAVESAVSSLIDENKERHEILKNKICGHLQAANVKGACNSFNAKDINAGTNDGSKITLQRPITNADSEQLLLV